MHTANPSRLPWCLSAHTKRGQRASRKPISIVSTAVRKLWDRTSASVGNWGYRKFWVCTLGQKNKISHSVWPVVSNFKLCHRHQSKFCLCWNIYSSVVHVHVVEVGAFSAGMQTDIFHSCVLKEVVNIIVCCGGLFAGPWPKLRKQLTILNLPHKIAR